MLRRYVIFKYCFICMVLLGVSFTGVFGGITVEDKDSLFFVRGKYFSFELLKNGALQKITLGGSGGVNLEILKDLQLRFWSHPGWNEFYQEIKAEAGVCRKEEIKDGVKFIFEGTMEAPFKGGRFSYNEKVTVRDDGVLDVSMKIKALADMKLNRVALCPKLAFYMYKGEKYTVEINGKLYEKSFPDSGKNEWVEEDGMTKLECYYHLLPGPVCSMEFPTVTSQIEKWALKFDVFNLAQYDYPEIVKDKEQTLQVILRIPDKPVEPKKVKGEISVDLKKKLRTINKELFGLNLHYTANIFKNKKLIERLRELDAAHFRMCIPCMTYAYNFLKDPISPYEGAEYNFDAMDKWVDFFVNDLKKHLILTTGYYCPPWLSKKNKHSSWGEGKLGSTVWWRSPPKDPEKLADIFVAIIKHYNIDLGWKIRYVEIGNEPDLEDYWIGGTYDEFLEKAKAEIRKIKQVDPTVLIGGPALASMSGEGVERTRRFIDCCLDDIDIISWHRYGSYNYEPTVRKVRELIDNKKKGEKKMLYLSELNGSFRDIRVYGSLNGAIWGAKAYKSLIEQGFDLASWFQYGSSGGGGLLNDITLEIFPAYYMFKMFTVYGNFDGAEQIETKSSSSEGIEVLGCRNDGDFALMCIKDIPLIESSEKITVKGLEETNYKVKVYLLDDTHNADVVKEFELDGRKTDTFNYNFGSGRYIFLFTFKKVV